MFSVTVYKETPGLIVLQISVLNSLVCEFVCCSGFFNFYCVVILFSVCLFFGWLCVFVCLCLGYFFLVTYKSSVMFSISILCYFHSHHSCFIYINCCAVAMVLDQERD